MTCIQKPTASNSYLHFESASPIEQKRTLVKTLFNRARRICTSDTLPSTEEKIKKDLMMNSYPVAFIDYHSCPKPKAPVSYDVPKKPVYISLPFKGDNVNTTIKKRLKASIERTYPMTTLKMFNKSNRMGPSNLKVPTPIFAKSKCIYQFACVCGDRYIGRTDRKLDCRVKEHMPSWLTNGKPGIPRTAITKHLVSSGHVVDKYQSFNILNRQRHPSLLRLAEAVLIRRLQPNLCIQKLYVTPLNLPWG